MPAKRYIFERTLAADEVQYINFGGTFFYVMEADGPVRIGYDDEDGDAYEIGTGPVGAPSDRFAKLKITNAHTAAQRVKIIVGEGEFRDTRFALAARSLGVPFYPAPTRLAPRPETSIAAASGIPLDGVFSLPDRLRKSVVVQNLDAGVPLEIRVGGVVANVVPGSAIPITHTFEFSGPCEIYNPNGSPVAVRIAEIVVSG